MTRSNSPLPAAPPLAASNGAVPGSSLSAGGGATFLDQARAILSADPQTDTVGAISAALMAGQVEYTSAQELWADARRRSTSTLTPEAEAETARGEMQRLAAKVERVETAFGELNQRLESLIIRQKAEADATAKASARARHAAASAAISDRYPALADEMASIFSELQEATNECRNVGVRDVDCPAGRALGVLNAGGIVGVVFLPSITGSGRHWPEDAYAKANRAMATPPGFLPSLAELKARGVGARN